MHILYMAMVVHECPQKMRMYEHTWVMFKGEQVGHITVDE